MEQVLSYIVVALLGIITTVGAKTYTEFKRTFTDTCKHTDDRMLVMETKMDIYLAHAGFDVQKVNRAIREHKEEIAQNNKPSVGCINVKELYMSE